MGGGAFGALAFGWYSGEVITPQMVLSSVAGTSTASATVSTPAMLALSPVAATSSASATVSTPAYLAPSVVAGQSSDAATLSTPGYLSLSPVAGQSTVGATVTVPAWLTLSAVAGQLSVTAVLTVLAPPAGDGGLRVDVYDASGTKLGFGPITSALACSYRMALDQVGSFTLDIPAEEERASYVAIGGQLWFYVAGEGLVFRGMVDQKQSVVDTDGKTILRVTGSSLARQLVNANTLLGMAFNGSTLSAAVGSNASANTLLYQTGWAAGALDVPGTTLLARFDGLSRWEALAKAAQQFKLHVREDHITLSGGNPVRNVDVGAFGASSGIVFKNVDSVSPNLRQNTALYPISGISVLEDGNDLWNSIIPVGAGEGINQLTLRWSDRSVAGGFPYDITTATGPDGQTYYYLEDSASVTAYGKRQRVVSIKDAAPLALSAAGMKAASNALYDQAVTYLTRYKSPPSTYEFETVGLRHVSQGAPLFKAGDKVRLLYHGVAHDRSGDRAWLTVDANVFLVEFTRTFAENGANTWKLTVSTVDRLAEDDAAKIGAAFQNVFALSVAMKPYTFTTKAGPQRGSLDSGTSKALTLTVTFDANVGMLHKAKLRWQATALRSNVSVAASGGAQTSSSGGGATTSAGGAQTSSSQSDHTHSVSGQSTSSNSGHRHRMFQYQSSDSLNTDVPSNNTSDAFTGNSAYESAAGDPHYHGLSNHTHQLAQHTHNIPDFRLMYGKASDGTTNVWVRISEYATYQDIYTFDSDTSHTHNISTATSAAGGSHSHTVSDHTHTVSAHTHSVSDHTHGLTYGVVEDTTPTNPQLSVAINGVDRTAAFTAQLGSAAWRDAMNSWQTVDVSSWLSDANGIVLQQNNTITFTVGKASTHLDIEAEVESLVTATSLVPV